MKSLKDILAEGVAVSSDFKLVNSVDTQGRPTTRKVRAHRKTISPKKDVSEDKPDVLTSIQNFVGRQYDEEVEQVDELKKSTLASYAKKAGDESSYYSFAAGSRSAKDPERLKSDKLAMKRQSGVNKAIDRLAKEEVELDEVSTEGYHKAAVKSRMDAAVKVMSSMGSDKQAVTKLNARNKGLKRLGDRTSAEMAKANSGPQKQRVEKEPTEAERRGYGQGRYMGDSVELSGEIIEASQSASVRMFKALQKIKQQRETEEARKKENEKRALEPKKQSVMEMDKSQTPPGRDGSNDEGGKKEYPAKIITPKKAVKDGVKILNKVFNKKKGVVEAKDPREYDYEGDMAKTQLRSIIANSQAVHDMLKDTTNLAEWVQSKITKVEDYISTVADYMTAEMSEQYVGTGDSNDMQRSVDKARMSAKKLMMQGIHGNNFIEKEVPEHDETDVKVTPNDKGGYSATLKLTPKVKPPATAKTGE